MTELAKLRDKYEIIGDVRGKGLQIGVEMVRDKVLSLERVTPCCPHMLEQRATLSRGGGHGSAVLQLTISWSSSDHL